MAALPHELIDEILSRLPVKSLLKFKTASKKWYSFISEDHKFHLKQSSSSSSASKNLILYQIATNDEGAVFRYSDIDTYESRKFIFPIEILKSCHLIGSANGLICLGPGFEAADSCCFIWNPCTGKYKIISLPFPVATQYSSRRQHGSGSTSLFGFGYDSISDDYKIIGDCDSRIRMFSLKTNSWKMLDFSVKCPWGGDSTFYSNGALHWRFTATRHITAFDLAKEKIFFLERPKQINWCCVGTCLLVFDCLGALHWSSSCASHGESIWVMREYGNTKSWAKLSISIPEDCSLPMGISRLGEVVYRTTGSELGFVKSDTQGRIADDDKSRTSSSSDAFLYKESLISPKCFDPK